MKYSVVGPPEELSFSHTTQYKIKDEKGKTFELKHTRTNISDEYLIWDENKGKWVDMDYDHPFFDFLEENDKFLDY